MNGFWIIVPVKDTRRSKERLAGVLSPSERQRLAHVMLEDVLAAVAPLRGRAPCVLVTVDPFAIELAQRYGMRTVSVGAHDGHTGAVDAGRKLLAEEGAAGFLTMPGDIPLVTSDEIAALLDAHRCSAGFTIAPADDRLGSNGVACSPPLAVPLRFGENSFYPHLDAARAVGIEPVVVELDGFACDVDTPADIVRLLSRGTAERSRAVAYLGTLDLADLHAEHAS